MSTRPSVYAPTDLAPLREAILSKEERHVEAAVAGLRTVNSDLSAKELTEEEAEWRPMFRAVVFGEEVDGGVSGGAVEYLARGLGVVSGWSLVEEWKLWAWFDYEKAVAGVLEPEAATLLNHLCEGRPFPHQGDALEGAYFAWLDAAEAASLRSALGAVDPATLGDDGLDEFHEELTAALDGAENGLLLFGW